MLVAILVILAVDAALELRGRRLPAPMIAPAMPQRGIYPALS
jgi:hypothetical protein